MSEDPPPPYLRRQIVCQTCQQTFEPTPEEAEALLAMERVGLPAAAECAGCAGRRIQ